MVTFLKTNASEYLNSFKSGDTKTIIATDVAARGIDVDGITLVVNYDIPDDVDSFIHRIGRTGRIGREWSGMEFSFKE